MKLVCLLLGLIAAPAWGQVYKCTDESGNTTWTDRPCTIDAEPEADLSAIVDPEPSESAVTVLQPTSADRPGVVERQRQAREKSNDRRRLLNSYNRQIRDIDSEIAKIEREISWHYAGGANRAEANVIAGLETRKGALEAQKASLAAERDRAVADLRREQRPD